MTDQVKHLLLVEDEAPLRQAIAEQLTKLSAASKAYEDELAALWKGGSPPAPEKLIKLNESLEHAEHTLLAPGGLPRREWYRHEIYAPGLYTGYGVKTVPGVREAIEQAQYPEADREIARAAQALDRLSALLDAASSDLEALR